MSLLNALKNQSKPLANAKAANPANREGENGGGIAGLARLALAVSEEPKPTPGLLTIIKRMATFYGYSSDELSHALSDARQHPDTWRELIRNDRHAAQFVDTPEHQLEVVAMLRADSGLSYAYTTRHEGSEVHVTLAVRDAAVADLVIPADKFDPVEFLKLLHFDNSAVIHPIHQNNL